MSRQIHPECNLKLTNFVDVWMVDLGSEKYFWRNHWVLVRKEKFSCEHSSFVRSVFRSSYLDMEVSEIAFVRLGVDSDD